MSSIIFSSIEPPHEMKNLSLSSDYAEDIHKVKLNISGTISHYEFPAKMSSSCPRQELSKNIHNVLFDTFPFYWNQARLFYDHFVTYDKTVSFQCRL